MEYGFRKITAGIPTPTEEAGVAALRHGCAELGLKGVEIQWVLPSGQDFDPAQPKIFFKAATNFAGMTNTSEEDRIYVNATLNPQDAARTVIHELQHLADARKYAAPRSEDQTQEFERRASDFETKKKSFWSRFSTEENEWVRLMQPVLLYRRRTVDRKRAIKAEMREMIAELRSEWS